MTKLKFYCQLLKYEIFQEFMKTMDYQKVCLDFNFFCTKISSAFNFIFH